MKTILILPLLVIALFIYGSLIVSGRAEDALDIAPEPTPAATPTPAPELTQEQIDMAIAAFPNRVKEQFRQTYLTRLENYKKCMALFTDTSDGLTLAQKRAALTPAQLSQVAGITQEDHAFLISIDPDCDIVAPPSAE